jgi:pimeloyl-ACP methyl ester carboxylesterase
MPPVDYDEFGLFHENLSEWGLEVPIPPVKRQRFEVATGRSISALVWGDATPTLAMIHGGAQNAHTFDTVALALQRPLVAFDLPGHGHSDAGPYGTGAASGHAVDVAVALAQLVTVPTPLVGMSLGGITSIILTRDHPELVSTLVLVDITPGVNSEKAKHITNFVNGPRTFDSFDELLARTIEHNPTRSVSSLRRGILHNAVQNDDGTWVWRHQRHPKSEVVAPESGDLWAALERAGDKVVLVRGMAQGSVVDDADEAELLRRRPDAIIERVEGAGHSVQGDAPLELARIIATHC